ncbi:hypothetical protein HDU85_000724 [Gaertneriomyces sp. JEL0708]|nr:hypothetical protein HDU85_000724 [Gaertneriomyces sp. JEL0708]
MQLPQTAVLAIRGPVPIPGFAMEEGSGWQATFDEMGEELAPSHPLVRATVQSTRHIVARFVQFLGAQWSLANIFLLGFSQGGSTAIDVALFGSLPAPLGGVVSISGWVDSSFCEASALGAMANTQVLVTQGERDEVLEKVWKTKRAFLASLLHNSLTVHPIRDKGHSMPSSAVEMRYIMEFFGKNLKLRNVALESMSDVYEVKLSQ